MGQNMLVITLLCLTWLPAQADIVRHWNGEGRLMFTNIPTAASTAFAKSNPSFSVAI